MICATCRREIADNSNYCYFCGARQAAGGAARPAQRRLMRSSAESKIAGVCSGFADYFEMDPTLMRLLWVLVTFITGIVPGLVVYLVAWAIMPLAPLYVPAPERGRTAQGAQTG
jgi:phage shock protein C